MYNLKRNAVVAECGLVKQNALNDYTKICKPTTACGSIRFSVKD